MARASKKAKWLALAHKKRCFFHYLFHFKLFLRSRLLLGSQVINWSKKIGRLMRKPQQKIQQRSVSWFRRDVPAISSSLLMSSICFSSGALHAFLFLRESLSAIFQFVKCKTKLIFLPLQCASLGREGLGHNWKQSMPSSCSWLQQAMDNIWVYLYEHFHIQGKPQLG